MNCVNKGEVSEPRKGLIGLLQAINFGRIEGLVLRNREPVADPAPRVFREVKFGGENGPRPEIASNDFSLKKQVVELFACFDQIRDGTIESLNVKHGLPFSMSFESKA